MSDPAMTDQVELLPCPFCAADGQSHQHSEMRSWIAGCSDPDCIAHQVAFDFVSEETAVAAWNTRAAIASMSLPGDEGPNLVECPTCGAKGYEPCRVITHRDQRERPDHAARKKAAALAAPRGDEALRQALGAVLGRVTAMPGDEIVRQLRLGRSASVQADDGLTSDAADLIEEFWEKFQSEKRANRWLTERLATREALSTVSGGMEIQENQGVTALRAAALPVSDPSPASRSRPSAAAANAGESE